MLKGAGFSRGSSNRVDRGGSWNNNPRNCRSANRNNNDPGNRNNNLGFRPVFECMPLRMAGLHGYPPGFFRHAQPRVPAEGNQPPNRFQPAVAGRFPKATAGFLAMDNKMVRNMRTLRD
ncbi:MAG: hypothetical protein KJ645_03365 [Planctomycetes bacterium]|nr:hypothetical protein [Planctomycetota bacterium]